jgi:hypothetical protein
MSKRPSSKTARVAKKMAVKQGPRLARRRRRADPIVPPTPEQLRFFQEEERHEETRDVAREILTKTVSAGVLSPSVAVEVAWQAASLFVALEHHKRPARPPGLFEEA